MFRNIIRITETTAAHDAKNHDPETCEFCKLFKGIDSLFDLISHDEEDTDDDDLRMKRGRDEEEEEEEEEEEDEDEEAPPPAEFLPTMKGTLNLVRDEDRGRLFWQGEWADNEAAYESGARHKFKYGGPGDVDVGVLAAPPNGTWNGYFLNSDQKIREKGMKLNFEMTDDPKIFLVTGHGANDYGDFALQGVYHADRHQLDCTKTYGGGDDDDDDDDDIDDADIDDNYDDELAGLHEEQDMPLEELAKRYGTDLPPHQLQQRSSKISRKHRA